MRKRGELGSLTDLVCRRTLTLRLQSQIGWELSAPQPRAFSNDAAKHAAEMRLVTQSALQGDLRKRMAGGEHLVLCEAHSLPHDVRSGRFLEAHFEGAIEVAVT